MTATNGRQVSWRLSIKPADVPPDGKPQNCDRSQLRPDEAASQAHEPNECLDHVLEVFVEGERIGISGTASSEQAIACIERHFHGDNALGEMAERLAPLTINKATSI